MTKEGAQGREMRSSRGKKKSHLKKKTYKELK